MTYFLSTTTDLVCPRDSLKSQTVVTGDDGRARRALRHCWTRRPAKGQPGSQPALAALYKGPLTDRRAFLADVSKQASETLLDYNGNSVDLVQTGSRTGRASHLWFYGRPQHTPPSAGWRRLAGRGATHRPPAALTPPGQAVLVPLPSLTLQRAGVAIPQPRWKRRCGKHERLHLGAGTGTRR